MSIVIKISSGGKKSHVIKEVLIRSLFNCSHSVFISVSKKKYAIVFFSHFSYVKTCFFEGGKIDENLRKLLFLFCGLFGTSAARMRL